MLCTNFHPKKRIFKLETQKKKKHKHTHIIEKPIPKCAIIRWTIILLQGKKEFNGWQKRQVPLHITNYIV
jgi:hypothetical protein